MLPSKNMKGIHILIISIISNVLREYSRSHETETQPHEQTLQPMSKMADMEENFIINTAPKLSQFYTFALRNKSKGKCLEKNVLNASIFFCLSENSVEYQQSLKKDQSLLSSIRFSEKILRYQSIEDLLDYDIVKPNIVSISSYIGLARFASHFDLSQSTLDRYIKSKKENGQSSGSNKNRSKQYEQLVL